jgi:hypothetical protein
MPPEAILCPTGKPFGWSFVREPIRAFVSGFLEVMCRENVVPKALKPRQGKSFNNMVTQSMNGTARLEQFVEDIENNRLMGREFVHAWPQAHRIDVKLCSGRIGFIGKLETFDESMAGLFRNVKHLPTRNTAGGECKSHLMSTLDYASFPTLIRRICTIVAIDFKCFDYKLPEYCLGHE